MLSSTRVIEEILSSIPCFIEFLSCFFQNLFALFDLFELSHESIAHYLVVHYDDQSFERIITEKECMDQKWKYDLATLLHIHKPHFINVTCESSLECSAV